MMSPRRFAVLILALAVVAPEILFAQPGYMRGAGSKKKEPVEAYEEEPEAKKEKPAPKARKSASKDDKEAVAGTTKESIEAYLQKRLERLKGVHDNQESFGKGFGSAWKKFWSDLFEERKLFEVRMARQRLNLFESLSSLSPSYHAGTISDFERLQSNQIKSFEDAQKAKMDEYFAKQLSDIKTFAMEQESIRLEFMNSAIKSWQAQKSGGTPE